MNESASLTPKVNPLMNLFKREATQTLVPKKPAKKLKVSDEKINDPLYQILSWRDDIKVHQHFPLHSSRSHVQQSIVETDPETWGTNLQDWDATSMQSFKKINLSNNLLSNGMVFVWGTKTNIGELMDYFDQMGYTYAQNFTFVLLSRPKIPAKTQKQLAGNKSLLNFFAPSLGSKSVKGSVSEVKAKGIEENDYECGCVNEPSQIFLNQESEYFQGSQRVLYMFRKINKKQSLELRHQRTSDVYFTIGQDDKLDWKAKEIVYGMIETLLINANYKQKEHLKLLQLWGDQNYQRKGWIIVSEDKTLKREETKSVSSE